MNGRKGKEKGKGRWGIEGKGEKARGEREGEKGQTYGRKARGKVEKEKKV